MRRWWAAVLIELGNHNPIGAAIGARQESEMMLAQSLLDRLPPKSLLIADRSYGVPKLLINLKEMHVEGQREFLVRLRGNSKKKVLEQYADGSALVEIKSGKKKLIVREINAKVRRGRSKWSQVMLWTSLLDWKKHTVEKLMEL